MKKSIIILAASAMLAGCTATRKVVTDEQRYYISWISFCANRGYNINDCTYQATNEYLDTWCGSTEEEQAFIKAGVEPY